ncbi:MAG TPA: extracellular solute-binding protein [Candidatus Binatia bacterium]
MRPKIPLLKRRIYLFGGLFLLFFPGSPARGQDPAKALREGELAWYTLIAVEDSQKIIQAFEKKYPGVKVRLFRNREAALLPRIIAEKQSGRPVVDVTSLRGIGYYQLWKRGLIQPYVSPESKILPAGFKDPKGFWADLYDSLYAWSYNTARMKDPPKGYEEVVQPRYRGRIGMDNEEVEWFAGLVEYWGKERVVQFLRRLAAQEIRARDGHTLIAQLMAAGEFDLTLTFSESVEKLKRGGAPVEWIKTFDPIIASVHPIAIAADAPHPEAARLFVDFALSKEGQSIIRSTGRVSPRPDVAPPFRLSAEEKLKVHPVPPGAAADYEGLQKEWREIFK